MAKSLERFVAFCKSNEINIDVQIFPEGTRTAANAAHALRTDVGNIVKSILFKAAGNPVLVLVPGNARVSTLRLSQNLGLPESEVVKGDADYTREQTGYAVGGIPPFGHVKVIKTFMDESLLFKDTLFAAAGTSEAVFKISPLDLKRFTNPVVADLAET